MAKVAVIIEDLFEDSEYTEPVKALKNAGHTCENIGLKPGTTVNGKRDKTPAQIEKSVQDVSVEDYDALLIPGGYSPDRLRAYPEPVDFVKNFTESGKPVFVICHGAQLLISADVIKGKKVTGWKSIRQDIKNAGAEFLDLEVVEDANIISSRCPDDLPAFNAACIQKLST
jgi:protease I